MAEEGVLDFHAAKRKAVERLNLPEARHLPSNQEIEQALAEHLQLFHARQLATDSAPPAQSGGEGHATTGTLRTAPGGLVTLRECHPVFRNPAACDRRHPGNRGIFLARTRYSYEETSKRLRFSGDRSEMVPVYGFLAEDTAIEVSVLHPKVAREAPLSPVDSRPMKRATLKEVESLITVPVPALPKSGL